MCAQFSPSVEVFKVFANPESLLFMAIENINVQKRGAGRHSSWLKGKVAEKHLEIRIKFPLPDVTV